MPKTHMLESKVDESNLAETIQLSSSTGEPITTAPRPGLELIEGTRPDLSQETLNLLRDRLRIASLLLFAGFLAFFIENLIFSASRETGLEQALFWMHLTMVAVTGIVGIRLCTNCPHIRRHLRVAELLVFGGSALLFSVVSYQILIAAAQREYVSPIYGPWLLLIFTYALFVPNSWRRALAVIAPMALAPLFLLVLARFTSADFLRVVSDPHYGTLYLEMGMVMTLGASTAVWGVGTMRNLRREAFEAKQLGQYQLKHLLDAGGMGEVYVGEHLLLKRPCAIKLIRPEKAGDANALARFEREVQSTARLTHWNTVDIYDFGRADDGTLYYVMEYLPGMNLKEIIDLHGPMPAGRVIHLIWQTCQALSEAHAEGMIHRDIKPGNIFAARRGGHYDVAKLLDFGLVQSPRHNGDVLLTHEQTVIGSPLYMSPEQATGEDADQRSDIYSLGVVAYILLTGKPPFENEKPIKVMFAHASQAPTPPSALNPDVPSDLEAVVMRCLEKRPEDRYQSADDLAQALLECESSGSWTPEAATDWWRNHGCPHKKKFDEAVRTGKL